MVFESVRLDYIRVFEFCVHAKSETTGPTTCGEDVLSCAAMNLNLLVLAGCILESKIHLVLLLTPWLYAAVSLVSYVSWHCIEELNDSERKIAIFLAKYIKWVVIMHCTLV